MRVDAGSVEDLEAAGFATTKVGSQPVCVFWHEGRVYAIEDRCPHLGFPLHCGTVRSAQSEAAGAVCALGWEILGEDPGSVVEAIFQAIRRGASAEQLGRAAAFAAALRVTRFHVQSDHSDWDVVHHGFTSANALHRLLVRAPSPLLLRGVFQLALKVFLDRFLKVPAARPPGGRRCGARLGVARRRRRVPLVPDLRGVGPACLRMAGGLGGDGPGARRGSTVPGGADSHPS